MILSPLEQFNILSLADFTPAGGFEVFYSTLLFFIWSIVYVYPQNMLSLALEGILPLGLVWQSGHTFFMFLIGSLLLPIGGAGTITSWLSHSGLLQFYCFMDYGFGFYHSILSYIWYTCSSNLSIFYSGDQLAFLTLPYHLLIASPSDVSTGVGTVAQIESNLGWICNASSAVNLYFLSTELVLSIQMFVYEKIIYNLLNLSTCNFSYLIFSLNSSTVWQFLSLSLVAFLFASTTWNNSLTLVSKNSWQTILELMYQFIFNVVNENAGPQGRKFFPLIFTTFLVVLTCNVLGMIPYSFTVTSHLIVTFCTALAIFLGINILGILKHGKHLLSLFFPPGAPIGLAPLLVLIEFVSYTFRVLSLSVRLFANLMSGHTLLKILATFSWGVVSLWGIFLLPVTIIFIVTGLEMAIAFLQAYIFAVLLSIYLNDAFNLH